MSVKRVVDAVLQTAAEAVAERGGGGRAGAGGEDGDGCSTAGQSESTVDRRERHRRSHVGRCCQGLRCRYLSVLFFSITSTPLPWLPVLTNIEPPALRRRAATDKLITQAECHRDWPLYDDVFYHPTLRLESRKPLWSDLQLIDVTSR